MAHTSKNYSTDGGNRLVIGGTLEVLQDASVTGLVEATKVVPATNTTLGSIKAEAKGEGDTVEVKIDGDSNKLFVPAYPTGATEEKAGLVKMAAAVPEAADEEVTAAEFKALLDALKTAGIMAED